MCSDGFVISRPDKLVVPTQAVDVWRKRFGAISDLEAHMGLLSTFILKKGIMHAGWDQPAAWMAGQLSRDNERAMGEKRVTDAKIAKTQHKPKPSRW